jgi:hypothetical protein
MGEFSKWLLHEDQKELFDYLFALVLNIAFVVLITLILWPLGSATFALHLAKGYWVFWTIVIVTSSGIVLVQRIFRMDLYSHIAAINHWRLCGIRRAIHFRPPPNVRTDP